jgi:ABC-2 type transport system permease protein
MGSRTIVFSFEVKRVIRRPAFWAVSVLLPVAISGIIGLAISRQVDSGRTSAVDLREQVSQLVVPGLLLAIFYMVVMTQSNLMLASTVEERENRVSEVLLTQIAARSLLTGKILGLLALAALQMMIFAIVLVAIALGTNDLVGLGRYLPENIPFEPERFLLGVAALFAGLIFYTSTVVALGSVFGAVKEASPYVAIVILLTISPMFFLTTIVEDPDSALVTVMTVAPLLAPVTVLLRNASGELDVTTGLLASLEMLAIGLAMLALAAHFFERGVAPVRGRTRRSR